MLNRTHERGTIRQRWDELDATNMRSGKEKTRVSRRIEIKDDDARQG